MDRATNDENTQYQQKNERCTFPIARIQEKHVKGTVKGGNGMVINSTNWTVFVIILSIGSAFHCVCVCIICVNL